MLRLAQVLPAEQLPQFLGELEEVRCTAIARLSTSGPVPATAPDELLPIEEACRRLGMGKDYLYRNSKDFPFTRRMGRRLLFSSRGIEKHIQSK